MRIVLGLVVAVHLGALGAPVRACEAALLLAMDVSGSVDQGEYRLQADGLAAALQDPQVRETLVQMQAALAVTQWSDVGQNALVIGWRRMLSPREVDAFAVRVMEMPRAFPGAETAVGGALFFALEQFGAVADCRRKIVDISSDGSENAGFTAPRARNAAMAAGVEVNALAIEGMGVAVSNFYRQWVITPGGFVETAQGFRDYARAIRTKIFRELTQPAT